MQDTRNEPPALACGFTLLEQRQDDEGVITCKWMMELLEGYIQFTSEGFTQIVRQPPVYSDGQYLDGEARGGISFGTAPFSGWKNNLLYVYWWGGALR
jgi:hypothetical protein